MAEFTVPIAKITKVEDVPDSDRLSLYTVLGYSVVSMKENGKHRFKENELVVYVPETAIVPDHLLKRFGFWDDEKDKGLLAGSKGNRVKATKIRGVRSEGLIWKLEEGVDELTFAKTRPWIKNNFASQVAIEGEDVAKFFEITQFEG